MNAIAHASALSSTGPQLDNRRVLAGLIDLVVLAAGGLVLGFAFGVLGGGEPQLTPAFEAVLLGWVLYYYFACESGGGQTLGKRVMHLRVVRVDGSAAGMGEIFVRTILRVIDGLFLYLVGLVVMLVSGKKRQRLGDMAGGTIVVDAREPMRVVAAVAAPAVAVPTVEAPEKPAAPPVEMAAPAVDAAAPAPDDPGAWRFEGQMGPQSTTPPGAEADPITETRVVLPTDLVAADLATPALMELAGDVSDVADTRAVPTEAPGEVSAEPVPVTPQEATAEFPVEDERGEPPRDELDAIDPVGQPLVAAVDTEPEPGEGTAVADVPETIENPAAAENSPEHALSEPEPEPEPEPGSPEPGSPDPAPDEPLVVKSVETVSAMDLVMGDADDEPADSPAPPAR